MAVVGATAQTTYSVTVKDGTVDAEKWTVTPNPATAGQTVTVKYTSTKKVKNVKAKKKAKPAATVATAPTATASVTVGSTDGFCATVPTASGLAAGTYYVWYYVKADNTHIDSEIGGPVTVTIVQATSFKVEGVTFYYVQGMTFNPTLTL